MMEQAAADTACSSSNQAGDRQEKPRASMVFQDGQKPPACRKNDLAVHRRYSHHYEDLLM